MIKYLVKAFLSLVINEKRPVRAELPISFLTLYIIMDQYFKRLT